MALGCNKLEHCLKHLQSLMEEFHQQWYPLNKIKDIPPITRSSVTGKVVESDIKTRKVIKVAK